jgi:hypothetical protein
MAPECCSFASEPMQEILRLREDAIRPSSRRESIVLRYGFPRETVLLEGEYDLRGVNGYIHLRILALLSNRYSSNNKFWEYIRIIGDIRIIRYMI